MYRCRKKNIGKSVWRSVRQLKKLQARPPRPATIISRIRTVSQLVHVCNNACKEIEIVVELFDANGYSMHCSPQYSETLVESHVPSRILYISSIRFSLDLFFSLLSLFFLSALLACHVFSLHLFSSATKQYCNKTKTREVENRAVTVLNLYFFSVYLIPFEINFYIDFF